MVAEPGSVYVMLNASFPGLAKVGRTTRPAIERVAELSASTGVPTPFVLAFEQAFQDCARGERAVHADLDRLGWRTSRNREFFRAAPSDIIRIVQAHAAAEAAGDGVSPEQLALRATQAARLLEQAEASCHGLGDTLQDSAEASRLYRAAAAAGSLVAVERLAMLYAECHVDPRAGRRRAMRLLKLGAHAGNYFCLASMAALFARDPHVTNFVKTWDQFFRARAASRCEEAEAETGRFVAACRSYIMLCLKIGIEPQHAAEMREEAQAIQLSLLEALNAARQPGEPADIDAEARHLLARALRWSYESLLPAGAEGGVPEGEALPGWAAGPRARRRLPRWLLGRGRASAAASPG